MIELKGKYNSAKVFTNNVEETAISQIIELCNQEFVKDSKIRIMPDTHAGAGCTIGTTMTIKDKIVPNLVGVDIGCGVHVTKFSLDNLDLVKIGRFVKKKIPSGFSVYCEIKKDFSIENLKCFDKLYNTDRIRKSLGTLGGGNHFIEINIDKDNNHYLVIHSGSRNLGKQVADYYQNEAYKSLNNHNEEIQKIIDKLKSENKEKEIQNTLRELKHQKIKKQLSYCEGELFNEYLHDMKIVQEFANQNRELITDRIVNEFNLQVIEQFQTIHNYIDIDNMILRKGAVSAKNGEKLIIPINMRDGSLICIGKGNSDWNDSAPHGAGRLMSRSKAKENISMDEFKESMKGIYSTTISKATLDEAPMAYKPMKEIIDNIHDTVEILDVIKPIYNFKAGD